MITTEHDFSDAKVDMLGFLSPQGGKPVVADGLVDHLDVIHVTAAPPFIPVMAGVLNANEERNGKYLQGIRPFKAELEDQPVEIIRTASELREVFGSGKLGAVLGLQSTPVDIDKADVRTLFDEGIRIAGIAYDEATPHGHGYMIHDETLGLTEQGRRVLDWYNETGIIVDVSHANARTAMDVLEHSEAEGYERPVIASHGGVREFYIKGFEGFGITDEDEDKDNNMRNLPLETLTEIDRLGGLIGIFALSFALSHSEGHIIHMADQIERLADEIDYDNLAIGTDSVYQVRDMAEWEEHSKWMASMLAGQGKPLHPRHPDYPGQLNRLNKLSIIDNYLRDYKFASIDESAQVVGENAMRFLNDHLPQKA